MNLVKVKCMFCGKEFFREKGRFNEAKKFGWNQYCSQECQNKAKTTRVEKACGNPNCNKMVSRVLKEFKRSKSGLIFCSQSCAAIVNNKKYPKREELRVPAENFLAHGTMLLLRQDFIRTVPTINACINVPMLKRQTAISVILFLKP